MAGFCFFFSQKPRFHFFLPSCQLVSAGGEAGGDVGVCFCVRVFVCVFVCVPSFRDQILKQNEEEK